jgi:hypothetical protein
VNKPHQDSTAPGLSRRSLLQSAAGAGLAVTAVATIGTAASAAASTVTGSSAASATTAGQDSKTALVVHVRDIKTGDIEVFSGTTQTRVRDRALAARIAKAIS